MDLSKPTPSIDMPQGGGDSAKPVAPGKPAFQPNNFGPSAKPTGDKPAGGRGPTQAPKAGKPDLWAPLKSAAEGAGGRGPDEEPEDEDEEQTPGNGEAPEGEEAPADGEAEEEEQEPEGEEADLEEGEVPDEEARSAKAITLKTKDGKFIKVPKDALFPYKNNGKIEWIPFNLAARQIDGLTNYSNKLGELNQEKARYTQENQTYKRRNEMWEGENQKRLQMKEMLNGVFTKGTAEDQIKAVDHIIANQIGGNPELYMYTMLDYLVKGGHAATWEGYSEDKRNYLKAQARINGDEFQRQRQAQMQAQQQGESEIAQSTEQVQQTVMQLCNTYGFTPQEWEARFDEVAQAKERGEIRDFDLNTVLYHTMNHRIHDEVVKNAAREINPIFKDPAKASELANALFELFKANPTKPRQWFIDVAKEAYGPDAAVRRVNEAHRRANGSSAPGGNGRMVRKQKQALPPYQRWR